jgi:hypothetical protein
MHSNPLIISLMQLLARNLRNYQNLHTTFTAALRLDFARVHVT